MHGPAMTRTSPTSWLDGISSKQKLVSWAQRLDTERKKQIGSRQLEHIHLLTQAQWYWGSMKSMTYRAGHLFNAGADLSIGQTPESRENCRHRFIWHQIETHFWVLVACKIKAATVWMRVRVKTSSPMSMAVNTEAEQSRWIITVQCPLLLTLCFKDEREGTSFFSCSSRGHKWRFWVCSGKCKYLTGCFSLNLLPTALYI